MQITTNVETQCCKSVCARQNADATVDVLREPLRFHGLVVLYSFRHEVQTHIKKSPRPHGGARCGMCRASSEGRLLLHPTKNKGPTPCEHPQPKHKTQEEHKHRDRETHAVSKCTQPKDKTKNRPRTTSIDREKGGENSQYTNPNE